MKILSITNKKNHLNTNEKHIQMAEDSQYQVIQIIYDTSYLYSAFFKYFMKQHCRIEIFF